MEQWLDSVEGSFGLLLKMAPYILSWTKGKPGLACQYVANSSKVCGRAACTLPDEGSWACLMRNRDNALISQLEMCLLHSRGPSCTNKGIPPHSLPLSQIGLRIFIRGQNIGTTRIYDLIHYSTESEENRAVLSTWFWVPKWLVGCRAFRVVSQVPFARQVGQFNLESV